MKAILFALFALLAFSAFSVTTVEAQGCATCELVIQFIEQWVESNATDAEILQYLQTVCNLFPGYNSTCDSISKQGLAQILAWIEADETPTEVCTQLGQCTSGSSQKTSNNVKTNVPSFANIQKYLPNLPKVVKPVSVGQNVECGGCEEVITVIEEWLDNTEDEQSVITTIEVMCTYMPEWVATCDAMVAAGVPAVVNWIVTYENSTVVCTQLKLCSTQVIVHVTDDCGECQQIVATIENYVATDASEETIETYLDVVCNLVPQWTEICDNVIAAELPQIITMIEAEEDPESICTAIDVCSGHSKTIHINYSL